MATAMPPSCSGCGSGCGGAAGAFRWSREADGALCSGRVDGAFSPLRRRVEVSERHRRLPRGEPVVLAVRVPPVAHVVGAGAHRDARGRELLHECEAAPQRSARRRRVYGRAVPGGLTWKNAQVGGGLRRAPAATANLQAAEAAPWAQ